MDSSTQQKELKDIEGKVAVQRQKLTNLMDSLNRESLHIEQLDKIKKEKDAELDALCLKLNAVAIEIEKLEKEKIGVGAEIDTNEAFLAVVKSKVSSKEEEVSSLISEVSALQEKREVLVAETEQTVMSRKRVLAEHEQKASNRVNILQSEIEQKETKLVDLDAAIEVKTGQLNSINSQIESAGRKRDSLIKENKNLEDDIVLAGDQIKVYQDRITDIKVQVEVLDAEVLEQTAVKNKLAEENKNLQDEQDGLVKAKVEFAAAKDALTQRELNIRNIYQKAGVPYPL